MKIHVIMELSKRFLEGLKKYNLTKDEIQNYKYCGGDTSSADIAYWAKNFGDRPKPPKTGNCACGHEIVNNTYIRHKTEDIIIVLGSCCVKRFVHDSGRTCEKCGDPHNNRKDNMCKKCRPPKGKVCEICGTSHKNRKDNKCNNCRKGICVIDKVCDTCEGAHRNFYLTRCDTCRKGSCDTCRKKINPKYDICYTCFSKCVSK